MLQDRGFVILVILSGLILLTGCKAKKACTLSQQTSERKTAEKAEASDTLRLVTEWEVELSDITVMAPTDSTKGRTPLVITAANAKIFAKNSLNRSSERRICASANITEDCRTSQTSEERIRSPTALKWVIVIAGAALITFMTAKIKRLIS